MKRSIALVIALLILLASLGACTPASETPDTPDVPQAPTEPDTPTGQHCLTPYACPYQHHCQQGVRQLSLFG